MSGTPELSVVVVTYNSAHEIAACLASVVERAEAAHEIIVVDNASSDATVEIVRTEFPFVRLILNRDNAGFSRANNQGIADARGRYMLFLNPDTELRPGAVASMIDVLARDSTYAGVGPRLVNPDGRVWRVSARRLPTLWTEFCQRTALDQLFASSPLFARKWYAPWNHDSDRDVECLTGAALLCRTTDVRGIGGFDESVPLYLDDLDLCRRLLDLGRLRYSSQAVVMHHHDLSGKQQPTALIVTLLLQALYRYFAKHRGRRYAAAWVAIVFCLGVAAALFSACLRLIGRGGAARRESARAHAFLEWVGGSKAGPWLLPQASPRDARMGAAGLSPNHPPS